VTGLSPRTTYHVRLLAANSDGTTNGLDVVFTTASSTPPPPPDVAVTGLKVSPSKFRAAKSGASVSSCATARRLIRRRNHELSKFHERCKHVSFCRLRDFTCRAAHPRPFPDRLIDCRRPGAGVTFRDGQPVGSCVYSHSCKSSKPTGGEAFRV